MTQSLRDLAAREHGQVVAAADTAAWLVVQAATNLAIAQGLPVPVAQALANKALAFVHTEVDRALAERMQAPGVDAVGIKVTREG